MFNISFHRFIESPCVSIPKVALRSVYPKYGPCIVKKTNVPAVVAALGQKLVYGINHVFPESLHRIFFKRILVISKADP